MRRSVLAFLVIPLACATTNSGGPASVETDARPGAVADANGSANETSSPPASDSGTSTDTGSTGEASSGESGGASSDCSSLPLCDDFESDTPGSPPSATLWTVLMGCNPNTTNAPVDGGL